MMIIMLKSNKRGPSFKVRSSRYREQIDDMISEGVKPLEISAWLKEQDPPESISKSTIYEYIRLDFNVEENAVLQYSDMKSWERLDSAGKRVASDMRMLEAFIEESLGIRLDLDISVDKQTTKLDIEKHKLQVIRAGIAGQKVLNDFLRAVEPETEVNVNVGLSLDDRVREYEKRFKSEADGGDSGDGV